MNQDELPGACFHGGAFFDVIGVRFDRLHRAPDVINADVLDAWFPPSPKVIERIAGALPWLVKTSPPTDCQGLIDAIAEHRHLPEGSLLTGAGSSSLIFLALREWLNPNSRVLLLEPSYGEYAHVLDNVIRCTVERFPLNIEENFDANLEELASAVKRGFDLVVIVNPNNPTGRHIPRKDLEEFLDNVPGSTRFWFDEAYIDYISPEESLEKYAAGSDNVLVSKSMSKVYALSGLRVAYLCGPVDLIDGLRMLTPPWAVGLPGQLAGVTALEDADYYNGRYAETHLLREALAEDLQNQLELEVVPGTANFVYCQLPLEAPSTELVIKRCQRKDLFLRDPALTTPRLGPKSLRIAVKDAATNRKMIEILGQAMAPSRN